MDTIIYPGTFGPPTLGHLDLIKRGLKVADRLVVAVVDTPKHKQPAFTTESRIEMTRLMTEDLTGVEIIPFYGLLVDIAREQKAGGILRGLRAVTDFDYELAMAHANHSLAGDIESIWMPTMPEYSFISSSLVREVAHFGGDTSAWLHPAVSDYLKQLTAAKGSQNPAFHLPRK